MASVSRFEPPLLRVSRPVSACSKCRTAKIKCDGKLPVCTACEKSGKSAGCSSANDQFAKGKERSYVASLEARIERLEKQLSQVKERRSSVRMLDVEPSGPTLARESPITLNSRNLERKEASVVDELVSDFGFLSVNATARDFHGFTKQMSFARLVLSTSSVEPMPQFTINELPPRYAITPLIQHYLGNIYVLYPFLSETKLFASLDVLYQDGGRYAKPTDRWTVRLVLAVALASLSRRRGDAQYKDSVYHAVAALESIEVVIQPGSIAGVQAILLLVLYAMLDPHHFKSWYLIGVASRAMVDLGLHQDCTEVQMLSAEADLRRRVYHSVYTLDRSISMAHLRAFSFTDDSSNVVFPSNQKPFSLTSTSARENEQVFFHTLDPAIQLLHLRRLQSAVYQTLYKSSPHSPKERWQITYDSLRSMHHWMAQIPAVIRKPVKKLFRSELLFGSILMLTASVSNNTTFKLSVNALLFSYTCEYADLMSSIGGDLEKFAFYTFHDILRASYIADRLIALLRDESNQITHGITSDALPSNLIPLLPPAFSQWDAEAVASKAARCLECLDQTLEYLGIRFGQDEQLTEFRDKAKDVREMLHAQCEKTPNSGQNSSSSC